MEVSFNKNTLRKFCSLFVVVALFFGMCSPALPYLPKVTISASAADESATDGNVTDGNVQPSGGVIASGTCGGVKYKFYKNKVLVIYGSGHLDDHDPFVPAASSHFYELSAKYVIIEYGVRSIGILLNYHFESSATLVPLHSSYALSICLSEREDRQKKAPILLATKITESYLVLYESTNFENSSFASQGFCE